MARLSWSSYRATWQALIVLGLSHSDIGRMYGCTSSTIGNVLSPGRVKAQNDKRKAYKRKWLDANPERHRASTRKAARRKSGLAHPTDETRNGPCQICGQAQDTLHLDHDHVTGEIRGWLCGSCNRAIGLMKDDPVRLRAAADYLVKL